MALGPLGKFGQQMGFDFTSAALTVQLRPRRCFSFCAPKLRSSRGLAAFEVQELLLLFQVNEKRIGRCFLALAFKAKDEDACP